MALHRSPRSAVGFQGEVASRGRHDRFRSPALRLLSVGSRATLRRNARRRGAGLRHRGISCGSRIAVERLSPDICLRAAYPSVWRMRPEEFSSEFRISWTPWGSMADDVLRMMEGPRPPRMADFFDNRLYLPVTLRKRRYQMRIHCQVAEIEEEESQTAPEQNPLTARQRSARAESGPQTRRAAGCPGNPRRCSESCPGGPDGRRRSAL